MPKLQILIVEANDILARSMKTRLCQAGYEVVGQVAEGVAAIVHVQQQLPDLVLMGIQLQGELDGIATAEQIQHTLHCPVVYFTQDFSPQTFERAKTTQPYGYLLSSCADCELIATIEVAIARHQSETALRASLQQQQELCEVQARFVSMVAHEFRNPLNSILFSTELLNRYGAQLDDGKRDAYFQRIHGSIRRMHQLLDDVLTIGEAEAGKLSYQPQPLNLLQVCHEVLHDLQPPEGSTHPVVFTYSPDSLHGRNAQYCLDERLIRHILGNLLSNAIKYSPQGQSIAFDLVCRTEDVVFRIQDQGIGIPIADQGKLFHEFHRASNVRTIPGTGLGLAIVKQCVDRHGGRVEFQSEVGRGTTFTVTLPLAQTLLNQPSSVVA
ncbi:ATP-binding protein [Alkalinema pantanalense CENA528]|uniref:hybrid sensor histidine kinase/response regulator n=1 Tax=Alkalinema pantanalense TaxID=1620705 RepID=UPI003D6E4FFB